MAMKAVIYAGLALALTMVSPAGAQEVRHRTDYTIALAGLPVAKASFSTVMDSRRYTISGDIRSAGLADLITTITAKTTVNGTLQSNRLQAQDFVLDYTSGKRNRLYTATFRNGNVVSSTIQPEPRRDPKAWVPVSSRDLRAVLDPISGLIFPTKARICPRTLPIFDGESRMDLVLSQKGQRPFSTRGFKGETLVCGVRYIPRSGYKTGRKDIDYLRNSKAMEIWFAKAEAVDVYAPVYVKIPTEYGMLTISAVRFGGQ